MNGAHKLIDVLARSGVGTVFGLPGSTEASLLVALRDRTDVRYVLGLHEGAVVSMADGYARVTGRPGVAGLHTTVGTLNGASQMYNASRDGSPVVVTVAHKDRTVLSESGFCAHPYLPEAVQAYTKWSHQTLTAAELGCDLWRALHVAMTAPTGPTFLAVPEDMLRAEVPAGAPEPAVQNTALWPAAQQAPPGESECATAAALLAAARWPVIVAGSAARGCAAELGELADRLSAPLVCTDFTDLSDLPFPTADDRYLGLYGEERAVLDDCDVLLAVGARVSFPFSAARHPSYPPGARLIHVHPDPAEIGRRLPTDAGLACSPAAFLRAVSERLRRPGLAEEVETAAAARTARLAALRSERGERREQERAAGEASPMPVDLVAAELNEVLPPDAVIVDEGVRSSLRLLRHLEVGGGQTLLRSSGGALGWGVPAAVGASIGCPQRPVVALVGDGSYQFSVQAIWTAVQQHAQLTVVVLDNGGYLAVKQAIGGYLGIRTDLPVHPGTQLPGIDHAGIAAGYGASGARAEGRGEVAAAVKSALAAGGVHVVVVPVADIPS